MTADNDDIELSYVPTKDSYASYDELLEDATLVFCEQLRELYHDIGVFHMHDEVRIAAEAFTDSLTAQNVFKLRHAAKAGLAVISATQGYRELNRLQQMCDSLDILRRGLLFKVYTDLVAAAESYYSELDAENEHEELQLELCQPLITLGFSEEEMEEIFRLHTRDGIEKIIREASGTSGVAEFHLDLHKHH